MPTDYPDDFDDFGVPSLPEETPLSSAGDSTRNHTELLRDIGDATEALEHNAALKGHNHSGDATDITKGAKLAQANTHESPDTNTAAGSLHHTLGTSATQAAAGNHNHDYNTLLNVPWIRCESTSRPGSPYPGLMIYETDTDRVRVWGSFAQNQISAGLDSTEDFTQTANPNNLGATEWEQTYAWPDTAHGLMAVPDGLNASWIDGGAFTNTCRARRINPADKETETDDQVIIWKTGNQVIEWDFLDPFIARAANDVYLRMSADSQSYWHLEVSYDRIFISYTTTGPDHEVNIGFQLLDTDIPNTEWRAELKDRTLTLYRFGEVVAAFNDNASVTSKGAAFRGWGMGMRAGTRLFGQTTPANVQFIRAMDLDYYSSVYRWTVLPVANVPNCRLRQSSVTAQKIINTGSLVEWNEEVEDQFNFFDKDVSKTDIVMKEPGLYHIDAAVQWDPSFVPDTAFVVLCVNGLETTIRNQGFMRGQGFTPGFSQTLGLSGKLRFGANDVLTLKCKFIASSGLLDLIFLFFDSGTKINSRIDLIYLAP